MCLVARNSFWLLSYAKLVVNSLHITHTSPAHRAQHTQRKGTRAPSINDIMFQIILLGFLPTNQGHSCALHPFECHNALVLEKPTHGVGLQIRMKMIDRMHLAGYLVNDDGSDGCRVCFAAREYAVGVRGQRLNGESVWIKEMVLPDDDNVSKRALFHCNWWLCHHGVAWSWF